MGELLMRLWYRQPATCWTEALPLGNGRLGAMIYGNPAQETVALNEDTLWSGYPGRPDGVENPWEHMQKARELVMAGRRREADSYIEDHLLGRYSESYLPAGTLRLRFPHDSYEEYERVLDLERSVQHQTYRVGDTVFWREEFISAPDQAMIFKYETTQPGSLSFDVTLGTPLRAQLSAEAEEGTGSLLLEGIAPSDDLPGYLGAASPVRYGEEDADRGMRYCIYAVVSADGGSVSLVPENNNGSAAAHAGAVNGASRARANVAPETGEANAQHGPILHVEGARYAEIRLYIRTSFNGFDKHPYLEGTDCRALVMEDAGRTAPFSYDALKKRHIADYRHLYSRVSLRFAGGPDEDEIPVDERLRRFQETQDDPYLYSLLFQYGRYLTIAASREGTQPMNLQGIWNDQVQPPWSSNYTTNINLEMNYWGAEKENLSELTEPLFDMIRRLSQNGQETARRFYHTDGAVMHHNTDLWAMTHPVGQHHPKRLMNGCGFWNMAYGWLTRHLFEHYEYTLDRAFLQETCLPALELAARFFLGILIDDGTGRLVLPVSSSPENTFIENGEWCHSTKYTTMSVAVVREVFSNYLRACELLDTEEDDEESASPLVSAHRSVNEEAEKQAEKEKRDSLAALIRTAMGRLPEYTVGSRGQLLEWDEEFAEAEPHHRHISHLYPLYPGGEFHVQREADQKWIAACRASMEERTDVGTGWSLGWKINVWARLGEGDRALSLLKRQLHYTTEQRVIAAEGEGAGTYLNLFDAHPPFQIDGNFAAAAGISEMLLQSYDDQILLLPALPKELGDGQVCGLRTKNALQIDLFFSRGRLLDARVYSKAPQKRELTFLYAGRSLRRTVEGTGIFRLTERDFT